MKNTNLTIQGEILGASQQGALEVELFLQENYLFRHNVLNGKVEFATKPTDDAMPTWKTLTQGALNSIIIRAKREKVVEKGSPKTDIVEYVNSDEVPVFDPIADYLNGLPTWNGENHVSQLFGRLPGVDSELQSYLGHLAALSGRPLAADGHPSRQRMRTHADWRSGVWQDELLQAYSATSSESVFPGWHEPHEQV